MLNALKYLDKQLSGKKIAEEHSVRQSTICDWEKQENDIEKWCWNKASSSEIETQIMMKKGMRKHSIQIYERKHGANKIKKVECDTIKSLWAICKASCYKKLHVDSINFYLIWSDLILFNSSVSKWMVPFNKWNWI